MLLSTRLETATYDKGQEEEREPSPEQKRYFDTAFSPVLEHLEDNLVIGAFIVIVAIVWRLIWHDSLDPMHSAAVAAVAAFTIVWRIFWPHSILATQATAASAAAIGAIVWHVLFVPDSLCATKMSAAAAAATIAVGFNVAIVATAFAGFFIVSILWAPEGSADIADMKTAIMKQLDD